MNAMSSSSLWHSRLRNHSSEVISLLPSGLGVNFRKAKYSMCELCFRLKQTCSQFYVSHHKAKNVFELSTVIVGDLIKLHPLVALTIFSQLWMMLVEQHGSI